MLTALARCWSAALTPTWRGLTGRAMSRRPPAFRAVTVPLSPELAAIATPSGISGKAGPGPAPAPAPGADAGAGTGTDATTRRGGALAPAAGFGPGRTEDGQIGRAS